MLTDAQLQAQFSSAKDDWETPQDFFNKYDAVYHYHPPKDNQIERYAGASDVR